MRESNLGCDGMTAHHSSVVAPGQSRPNGVGVGAFVNIVHQLSVRRGWNEGVSTAARTRGGRRRYPPWPSGTVQVLMRASTTSIAGAFAKGRGRTLRSPLTAAIG